RTLDELVSENGYVRVTQWAIRIFFILVDALPVILKVLTGRTTYDELLSIELAAQRELYELSTKDLLRRAGAAVVGHVEVPVPIDREFNVESAERIGPPTAAAAPNVGASTTEIDHVGATAAAAHAPPAGSALDAPPVMTRWPSLFEDEDTYADLPPNPSPGSPHATLRARQTSLELLDAAVNGRAHAK
ncbi:DUF4407 domain-containing protein, partial [Dactylosporangium sp. NPDC049525]|uniref:DUF4407 domain-containing protein n=1 Tax=Dactylosporangium sp. NPDC049525 TaxID=3154730 RepID=UPI00343BB2C8